MDGPADELLACARFADHKNVFHYLRGLGDVVSEALYLRTLSYNTVFRRNEILGEILHALHLQTHIGQRIREIPVLLEELESFQNEIDGGSQPVHFLRFLRLRQFTHETFVGLVENIPVEAEQGLQDGA